MTDTTPTCATCEHYSPRSCARFPVGGYPLPDHTCPEHKAKAGHTPLPWLACGNGDCRCGHIWSAAVDELVATCPADWGDDPAYPDGGVGPEQRAANARFIVQAVNSHARLVEALRDCVALLERLYPNPAPNGQISRARAALSEVSHG